MSQLLAFAYFCVGAIVADTTMGEDARVQSASAGWRVFWWMNRATLWPIFMLLRPLR